MYGGMCGCPSEGDVSLRPRDAAPQATVPVVATTEKALKSILKEPRPRASLGLLRSEFCHPVQEMSRQNQGDPEQTSLLVTNPTGMWASCNSQNIFCAHYFIFWFCFIFIDLKTKQNKTSVMCQEARAERGSHLPTSSCTWMCVRMVCSPSSKHREMRDPIYACDK